MDHGADDGSRLTGIRPEEIVASAQAFAPATAVSYEQCLDLDQWSVSSALDPFRPLHRVALGDNAGTELYVSNATGEVVRVSDYVAIAWFGVSDFCVSPAWLFAAGLRRALARRCAPDWSRLELWEAIRRKYASEAAETAAGGDAR